MNIFYTIGALLILIGSAMFLPAPNNIVDEKNTRFFFALILLGAAVIFITWMLDVN
jgi:hypothetical protein